VYPCTLSKIINQRSCRTKPYSNTKNESKVLQKGKECKQTKSISNDVAKVQWKENVIEKEEIKCQKQNGQYSIYENVWYGFALK